MRCVVGLVTGVIVVLAAGSACGQTPPPTAPPAQAPQVPVAAPAPQVPVAKSEAPPPGTKWFLGVTSGFSRSRVPEPVLGGEFGIRVRKNVQVVVEGGWFKDVVTDSRIVELASFATYLQQNAGTAGHGGDRRPGMVWDRWPALHL